VSSSLACCGAATTHDDGEGYCELEDTSVAAAGSAG